MTRVPELSPDDYVALAEFRYQLRSFLHRRARAARSASISPQQYQLLLEIKGRDGRGPATVGVLAERLHIRHHSAVGLVDRLERRGLVRRRRAVEDRRRVLVELRPAGQARLQALALYSLLELRSEAPALTDVLRRLISRGRRLRNRRGRSARPGGAQK